MSWSTCCHQLPLLIFLFFCESTLSKNIPSLLKFWFEKNAEYSTKSNSFYILVFTSLMIMTCSTFSREQLKQNSCLKQQSDILNCIYCLLDIKMCLERMRYNSIITFAKLEHSFLWATIIIVSNGKVHYRDLEHILFVL